MCGNSAIVWPTKAKVAVMITVDLDAEFIWIGLDSTNINRPKTLSMGQYGLKRGLQRLLNVLDQFGIKATFFVPGRTAETYPQQISEIANKGHEVGHHGYEHENFALLTKRQQKEVLLKGVEAIEICCGIRPEGFRLPEGDMTSETLSLLQELGFSYSNSMNGNDLPYLITVDGKPTNMVEIPSHWELTDFPFFAFNFYPPFPKGESRIANYTQVLDLWRDEFNAYYRFGLSYIINFDPQIIGTPGRIALLENLLNHITSRGRVWFCTGSEMANFWRATHSN